MISASLLTQLEIGVGVCIVICFLLRFNMVWLVPCFCYGYAWYVPIRYGCDIVGYHDDYFYYARIKKIIDGDWLNSDPICMSFNKRKHTHCTSQLSFFMCGIFSLFNKNIWYSFFGNALFYPIVNAGCSFALVYVVTQSSALALLLVCLVFYVSEISSLYRVPNILFTNIHLLLICLFGILYSANQLPVWFAIMGMVLISVAPIICIPNAIFTGCFVFVLIVSDLQQALSYYWLFMPAGCIAAFFMFFSLSNLSASKELWRFGSIDVDDYYKKQVKPYVWYSTVLPLVLSAACWYLGIPYGFSLTAICGVSLFSWLITYFQCKSLEISLRSIFRGTIFCTQLCGMIAFFILIQFAAGSLHAFPELAQTAILKVLALSAALYLAIRAVHEQYCHINAYATKYINPEFRGLINWAQGLTSKTSILTLDFVVNTNLSAYTSAYFYIPQAIQSTATVEEVMQRFNEAALFLKVSSREYRDFLSQLLPVHHFVANPQIAQYCHATLVLTYCLYCKRWPHNQVMNQDEIIEHYAMYRVMERHNAGLSDKATVLIVSQYQKLLPNLFEKLAQSGIQPLYAGRDYRAYTINAELMSVVRA